MTNFFTGMVNSSSLCNKNAIIYYHYLTGVQILNESALVIIILILALLLMLALATLGSRLLLRRAINAIILRFREKNAINPLTAMTQDELGLSPKGIMVIRGLRDYKPIALELLIRSNIIQITGDDRMFLSEEILLENSLKQRRKEKRRD